MQSSFKIDMSGVKDSLETSAKILEGKNNNLINKQNKNKIEKELQEQLSRLINALEILKNKIISQDKIFENLEGVEEDQVRLAQVKLVSEIFMASQNLYHDSIDLASSLLDDKPYKKATVKDMRLLTETITLLNVGIENPPSANFETLRRNIIAIQDRADFPNNPHHAKWAALGKALVVVGIGIALAAIIIATALSGGGVLLPTMAAIMVTVGILSGGATFFLGGMMHVHLGEEQPDKIHSTNSPRKEVLKKTKKLQTLFKESGQKKSQGDDSTASVFHDQKSSKSKPPPS